MEEFSLEKYNTGNYDVITRDGRKVRILCTDANLWCEEFKIVALVDLKNRNVDDIRTYTIDGIYDIMCENENDLFLTKKKWKPQKKEEYWVVSSYGEVVNEVYQNSQYDYKVYDFGNCFKTKEEAETMAESIKKLLNQL